MKISERRLRRRRRRRLRSRNCKKKIEWLNLSFISSVTFFFEYSSVIKISGMLLKKGSQNSSLDIETQNHYDPYKQVLFLWTPTQASTSLSISLPIIKGENQSASDTCRLKDFVVGCKNSNFRSQKVSLDFKIKLEFPGWKLFLSFFVRSLDKAGNWNRDFLISLRIRSRPEFSSKVNLE